MYPWGTGSGSTLVAGLLFFIFMFNAPDALLEEVAARAQLHRLCWDFGGWRGEGGLRKKKDNQSMGRAQTAAD